MKIAEVLRPVVRAAALIVVLFLVGTIGYRLLGPPGTGLLDALYMTVITLTTVGYGEVVDLSASPYGRVFTIALILLGVGAFLYFFTTTTAFAVEGTLGKLFWRRRMHRRIEALHDHYIVCGGGHTGEHIVRELKQTGRPYVLIEPDAERLEELHDHLGEFPVIEGDATSDEILTAAGIERARGLVAAVRDDKDNLIITISARILNADMRIIARCVDVQVQRKLRRAGADSVVSPNKIGGLRMVSELVRPTAVSFLDQMLRERDQQYRVEEAEIAGDSAYAGMTLGQAVDTIESRVLIVALRRANGKWIYNPGARDVLEAGMSIVFIGSPEGRAAVAEHTRA